MESLGLLNQQTLSVADVMFDALLGKVLDTSAVPPGQLGLPELETSASSDTLGGTLTVPLGLPGIEI